MFEGNELQPARVRTKWAGQLSSHAEIGGIGRMYTRENVAYPYISFISSSGINSLLLNFPGLSYL